MPDYFPEGTSPLPGDGELRSLQKLVAAAANNSTEGEVRAAFTQTEAVTVANTTSETNLAGNGTGSLTIPANYLTAGKTYCIETAGAYSTNLVTDLNFRIRLGGTSGTVIGRNFNFNAGDEASNSYFRLSATFVYRGSNTVSCFGLLVIYSSVVGSIVVESVTSPLGNSTTINPATDLEIAPTIQWSEASPGNTLTCHILSIVEIN